MGEEGEKKRKPNIRTLQKERNKKERKEIPKMTEVLRPNPLARTVTDAADVYGLSSEFGDLSMGTSPSSTTATTASGGQQQQKNAAENYAISFPRRAYSYTVAAAADPGSAQALRRREVVALTTAARAPASSSPATARLLQPHEIHTPAGLAALAAAARARAGTVTTGGGALGSSSKAKSRPALPGPQRSYSVMDEEPVPLTQRPGSALTLPDLPPELHYAIFDFLDPIDSTCLGLTSRQFYAVHRRMHGTVSLGARREGPNDMEWVWRHAGPFVPSKSSKPSGSSSSSSSSARNALAVLSPRGQVYCRKCRTARCELHKHIRDWMNGVEGGGKRDRSRHKEGELQYCEVSQKFGRAADDGAPPVCYRSSPRHPHRCGRHTRQQRAVRLT